MFLANFKIYWRLILTEVSFSSITELKREGAASGLGSVMQTLNTSTQLRILHRLLLLVFFLNEAAQQVLFSRNKEKGGVKEKRRKENLEALCGERKTTEKMGVEKGKGPSN